MQACPVWASDDARALAQRNFEVAQRLEHGEGIPRDSALAASLYCDAARDGHVLAQYNLGWMHANGRGLPRDDGLAKFFFGLAAAQGDAQAARMLARISVEASPAPPCMSPPSPSEPPAAPAGIKEQVAPGRIEEPVDSPSAPVVPDFVPADKQWVATLVRRQAPRFGIAPELALAVIAVESNFDPLARSPRNAMGLMQLIPETAERFRVTNIFDPRESVRGGLAYLRWLLAYYRGNLDLTLAAYNAGEGAVDRFRGIPPFVETRDYVRRVRTLYREASHPFDESVTHPSTLVRIR